jgi:glycosyltransferase involved in cell wall biosynthesis
MTELNAPMSKNLGEPTLASSYVLITAAYNEDRYIENVLRSVVSQAHAPKRWVIVSDGSTDRTDELVSNYAKDYPFIELLPLREKHDRNFAAQVNAIRSGYERLKNMNFEFVGNLDADVSFGPEYFQRLIQIMRNEPDLGLSGGFIYEDSPHGFRSRQLNTKRSVAHAVQFFRRECYESIGGYIPLPYGGPDWCAEISARMKGWRVEAIPALQVNHHRTTGGGTGLLRYAFQQGMMDHSFGSHPAIELLRCVRRLRDRTYGLSALVRMSAFLYATVRRQKRPVSEEFVKFLRKSEMERLLSWDGRGNPPEHVAQAPRDNG